MRLIPIALVLTIGLLFAACGGAEESPTSTQSRSNSEQITKVDIVGASFVSAQAGWVLGITAPGSKAVLLATRDGGGTWSEQWRNDLSPSGVQFVNDEVGWVSGQCSTPTCLFKTSNGGLSWQELHSAPQGYGVPSFVNEQTGWVLARPSCPTRDGSGSTACPSTLFRTTDGGISWNQVALQAELASSGVEHVGAIDDRTVWVISGGDHPLFATSRDGGDTWKIASNPCGNGFEAGQSASLLTADEGWLLCGLHGDALYHTTDGGEHWLPKGVPGPTLNLQCCGTGRSILFTTPNDGWFAGMPAGPLATHDRGLTWHATLPDQSASTSPTDWVGHVYFVDSKHGWAVSEDSVFATDDVSGNWRRIYPPSLGELAPPSSLSVQEQARLCASLENSDVGQPAPLPGQALEHPLHLRTGDGLVCWQDVALESYYKIEGTARYVLGCALKAGSPVNAEDVPFSFTLPANSTSFSLPQPKDSRLTSMSSLSVSVEALQLDGSTLATDQTIIQAETCS